MDHPISKIDLNFFHVADLNTPQIISGLFQLDGVVDPELVRSRLEFLIELFPRLKYRANIAKAQWEIDSDFSVQRHFTPISSTTDPTAFFANSMTTELPSDRPLWKLELICYQNRSDLLFTFHHALADGIGLMAFILSFFDETPELSSESTARVTNTFNRLPKRSSALRLYPRLKKLLEDAIRPATRSLFVGPNSNRRAARLFDVSVADLKNLRLQLGCGSNDMILAAFTHALRIYGEKRGHKFGENELHVIIPFNRRTSDSITHLSNFLAGLSITLPMYQSDLAGTAREIGARLTAAKFSGEYGAYGLLATLAGSLPKFLQRGVAQYAARRTAMILTNIPGPRTELFLGGHRLIAGYGSAALMPGHGLAFSVINMREKLCCCLLTDPAIIHDGKEIADEFQRIFATNVR